MQPTTSFQISPNAVFEAFDDEVVVINMVSGSYYSLDAPALEIWTLLEKGVSFDSIIQDGVTNRAGEASEIEAALREFAAELEAEGLVVAAEAAKLDEVSPVPASLDSARTPFQRPTLTKFTDMQDLLLLDPIHEVDETGWPNAKAA